MRVFIAVEISDEVRARAAERIEFLRKQFPQLRVGWEKPEKLHLTIKFLGDIEPTQLADLIAAAEKSVRGFQPFELEITGANVFPPRGAVRVLWLDVTTGKENVLALNERLEDECWKIGFEREGRKFTPHLTVARLREPHNSQSLAKLHVATQFPPVGCLVKEITIFQSERAADKINYKSLSKILLENK